MFESLFNGYAPGLSVELEPTVISQLFILSYFHGFISFVGSKPAAFAVCFESYSTYRAQKVMNIHDLLVSEHYRGQGLGKVCIIGRSTSISTLFIP
ncbi:GNAT family N-acetyltransferase [Moritella sp. 5]|uniref:GNAT family N-acetyltransferase n=1 Tax=Moritella sp. 5 TaxID=2746231 RepID=UPI001BAB36DD|nr:GNAT family N-acetyltransferase [Moritella sp. 5]